MSFNGKTYDILKWVTMILLPALATLYIGVASIWKLPYPEELAGTIMAIVTFLGIVLGISTANYNKMTTKQQNDLNDQPK